MFCNIFAQYRWHGSWLPPQCHFRLVPYPRAKAEFLRAKRGREHSRQALQDWSAPTFERSDSMICIEIMNEPTTRKRL